MTHFKAAIFDWAGTTIDFGSFAPMAAFVRAFAHHDIEVSVADARTPMGSAKRDHIAAMLALPHVADQWRSRFGHDPDTSAIDRIFETFEPMNIEAAEAHATLVPGAAEAIAALREMGLKIGSTTGYTRAIMERVLPRAAAQGYAPDNLVCSDDLAEGRPGPLGMYQCFVDLAVYPPSSVIKVDDTEPGIAEGAAAGCVTVGVTLSGNHAAMTPEHVAGLTEDERDAIRERAGKSLTAAGADHLIDTIADLPALVRQLSVP